MRDERNERPITLAPIRKPLTAEDWRRLKRGSDQSDVGEQNLLSLPRVSQQLMHRIDREAQKRGLPRAEFVRSLIIKGLGD